MSNESVVDANVVFDALGEPVRRNILELLRDGPQPVGRLADHLPVGRPAVSKHLNVLSRAGLVRHDRRGTRNLYALAPPGMVAAQQWLVQVWDAALARYADAVTDAVTEAGNQAATGSGAKGPATRKPAARKPAARKSAAARTTATTRTASSPTARPGRRST